VIGRENCQCDFISKPRIPDRIGDRGFRLSGGQRQQPVLPVPYLGSHLILDGYIGPECRSERLVQEALGN
jgi:hypothetical protein